METMVIRFKILFLKLLSYIKTLNAQLFKIFAIKNEYYY